jgi:hypothetical protein
MSRQCYHLQELVLLECFNSKVQIQLALKMVKT